MEKDLLNIIGTEIKEKNREWTRYAALPVVLFFSFEGTHVCIGTPQQEHFAPVHHCTMPTPHTEIDDFSSARTRPVLTVINAGTPTAGTSTVFGRLDF